MPVSSRKIYASQRSRIPPDRRRAQALLEVYARRIATTMTTRHRFVGPEAQAVQPPRGQLAVVAWLLTSRGGKLPRSARHPRSGISLSCLREVTPSLRKMLRRWASTVRGLRNRLLATSFVVAPVAT